MDLPCRWETRPAVGRYRPGADPAQPGVPPPTWSLGCGPANTRRGILTDRDSPAGTPGGFRGLNILLLVAVLTVATAVVEIVLRLGWPVSHGYYIAHPYTTSYLTPDPRFLPGVSGQSEISTAEWGIRGDPLGDDLREFRILAIGGSTTANLYLDTPETWTHVVQERLRMGQPPVPAWVGNAGRSGATARAHAVHVKYLAPQVPGLDLIVILAGVNDMTQALRANPYRRPPPLTDPGVERDVVRASFVRRPGRLHEVSTYTMADVPWYRRTAIYELGRRAWSGVRAWWSRSAQDQMGAIFREWRDHRHHASQLIADLPPLDEALEEYRSNLEYMVDLAAAQGVPLVYITQPYLFREDLSPREDSLLWIGGMGDFQNQTGQPYYTAAALKRALDQFNAVMLSVCQERSIDLAAEVPHSTEYFFDGVHFTEAGGQLVGELIADYLQGILPPTAGGAISSAANMKETSVGPGHPPGEAHFRPTRFNM